MMILLLPDKHASVVQDFEVIDRLKRFFFWTSRSMERRYFGFGSEYFIVYLLVFQLDSHTI
jgi:hypothetical protein